MNEQEASRSHNRRFGSYLRQVREARKLSLDAVEEMTLAYPGRVTKSHLSRIENGQAEPSFPRMFALSQVYGVPIASLAEKFEVALRRSMVPRDVSEQSLDEVTREVRSLKTEGRYAEALVLYDALLEHADLQPAGAATDCDDAAANRRIEARLGRIGCLVHLWRFALAKEECEDLLSGQRLAGEHLVVALHLFTACCYRLGKYSIALMSLDQTERELARLPAQHRLHAQFPGLKGNLMIAVGRAEEAAECFLRASQRFDGAGDPFEANRFRLNYANALMDLGKPKEARRQLNQGAKLASAQGYDRQLAHALGSLGKLAFVDSDLDSAESCLLQSNAVSRKAEFVPLVFRNCYYLWRIAEARGDGSALRTYERTLRSYLGRVEDYMPEAQSYRRHLAGGAL